MKASVLLATVLSASVLATPASKRNNDGGASLPHLGPVQPACGPACLGQAQNSQTQCGPFDLACFCKDYQIQAYLHNCLNTTCFPEEVEGANGFLTGFCGLVNGYDM